VPELMCSHPRCKEIASVVVGGFSLCWFHNKAEYLAEIAVLLDDDLWLKDEKKRMEHFND
jgi:hypothetical protein